MTITNRKIIVVSKKLALACASVTALCAGLDDHPAFAQVAADSGGVETVVVTAEKRSENIQSVGMSISAFSGDQLERDNVSSVDELAPYVPGLTINQANNNRNSQIIIRNVGTSGTNAGTEPDVGVFLDGVFIPVAGPIYGELTDISTVEVLRGPQGTLYGRNTPVGAINITTRAPSQTTEGMIDLEAGNYGEARAKGYFGGGITDDLAGRASFWIDTNSGYLKNLYTETNVDQTTQYGGRGRLRWTLDSDTTFDVTAYYARIDANNNSGVQVNPLGPGGIVYGYRPIPTSFDTSPFVIAQNATNPSHPYVVPGKWEVNSATAAQDDTTTWGVSAQASRNIPAIDATLSDILAYNSYLDDAPNQGPGGLPLAIAINLQRDFTGSTSNELRLVSNGTHFIDYVAGVYLFHQDLNYTAAVTILDQANRVFPSGGMLSPGDHSNTYYTQTTNSAAAYGQATVHITDKLRGIGGLRYSYSHKDSTIDQSVINLATGGAVSPAFIGVVGSGGTLYGKITGHSLTYAIGGQYDVMQDVMAYATMSSGFKDGGFNSRSATALPYSFDPETSLNYELGAKTSWLDNHLVLNVDIYRMLVHGYQQSTQLPTGTGFVINNAGNFRTQGVEADLQAHPLEELTLNGTLSYANSVITGDAERGTCVTTYPFAGSTPPPGAAPFTDSTHKYCNYDGLKLPNAPQWQWSIGGRWEQHWGQTSYNWFVSASIAARSSTYLDPTLDPRSFEGGYALLSANWGFEPDSGNWMIQFWGKNLTDQRYYSTEAGQTQGTYISGGGTAAANGFIGWLGEPRTFGVDATYRF
jgi:iron complex outermembrane receptor protein